MSSAGRNVPPLGTHGNAWNNASTGANQNSAIIDTFSCPFVSAFGHVSGATTVTMMLSGDGANFYSGPSVVASGAQDFYINATIGARYVALQSSNNITATGTVQATE